MFTGIESELGNFVTIMLLQIKGGGIVFIEAYRYDIKN
jgi:hypothetical protein